MSTTPSMSRLNTANTAANARPLMTRLRTSFGYSDASASSSDEESDGSSNANSDDNNANRRPAVLPQAWGHRGASAAFPENTLASFTQAIQDGAEGIETDVHVSLDGTIVMFHDAYLNRTTNGKGLITKQAYKGGIDQLRTTKLPAQRICTFAETLDLLMQPGGKHVVLNIDVKLDNDPELLYPLMRREIESFPGWETELAPRLILGLWHAKYIEPAQRHLPYCRLAHIGVSPRVAKKYFWSACSAFSINYAALVGKEGQDFVAACKAAGKDLCVWTVNDRREMIQATKWGAKAILTDKTAAYLSLRGEMSKDWNAVSKEVGPIHSFTNMWYYTPINAIYEAWETFLLQRTAGPLAVPLSPQATVTVTAPTGNSDTSVSA